MSGFKGKAAAFLHRFSQALYTNPPEWLDVKQLPQTVDQSFIDSIKQSIDALPQSKVRSKLLGQVDQCAQSILNKLQELSRSVTQISSVASHKKRKHEAINQSNEQSNTESVKQSTKPSIKSFKVSLSTDSATFLSHFRSLYHSITSRAHPSSSSQQSLILSKIRQLFIVNRSTDDLTACLMITRSSSVTFPVNMRQQVIDILLQQSSKQSNNQTISFLHSVSVALAALFKSRTLQSSFSLVHEMSRFRCSLSKLTPFPFVGSHPQIELDFVFELMSGDDTKTPLSDKQVVDVIQALKNDLLQSFVHSTASHFDRHVALLTLRLALLKSSGQTRVTFKSLASRLAASVTFPADFVEGSAGASAWLMRGVEGKGQQDAMIEDVENQLTSIRSMSIDYESNDENEENDVDMSDNEQEDSSALHIEINSLIDQAQPNEKSNHQSNDSNEIESVVMDLADSLGPDVSSPPPRSRQTHSLRVDASNNQSNDGDEPNTPLSASHLSAPRDRSRSRSRSRSPARLLRSNTSPKKTRAGTQFGDILA